ncbi:hypothetical protein [Actinoplanes sp. URMC 104]|uniref:hypothetical protein n=1 Tax=Actinoplanes sp. URMC 104 TaxID=3423409 RepID=UPI003F19A6C3
MPDPAFRKLFTETETTLWASTEQVGSRARRRTARQVAAVAGIVGVGLVSGGVAVARVTAGPPQTPAPAPAATAPAPPPRLPWSTPTAAPLPGRSSGPSAPARIPGVIHKPVPDGGSLVPLLEPADAGPGYVSDSSGAAGDWGFEVAASALGCAQGFRPDTLLEATQALRKGRSSVLQRTSRFTAGGAAAYLDGVRQRVAACEPAPGRSVRVASRDFAGDESLLVVFRSGDRRPTRLVLVSSGDVLTEISAPELPEEGIRELGGKAAARM